MISGSLRATDSLLSTTALFKILNIPTTAGGTTYGPGTDGYVVSTNGSSVYWRGVKNNTSVGNLGWSSANNDKVLITSNTLAYWNGRYDNSNSNLAYCNKGAFGSIVTYGATTPTKWGVIYASTTSNYASTGAGTAGYLLQSNASSAPTWIQATNTNVASTIVKRDTNGAFSAGAITGTSFYIGSERVPSTAYISASATEAALINSLFTHCLTLKAQGETKMIGFYTGDANSVLGGMKYTGWIFEGQKSSTTGTSGLGTYECILFPATADGLNVRTGELGLPMRIHISEDENTLTLSSYRIDYLGPRMFNVTAAAGSWSSNTQSITVTGMNANYRIIVGLGSSATAEQYLAAAGAKLMCTAQGNNSITLTAFGTIPTINIPISVMIVG